MDRIFTFLFLLMCLFGFSQQKFKKSFEHFEISQGDSNSDYILSIPQEEVVTLINQLKTNSGFGPMFNYYGMNVIVDQMDITPDGALLMILRREDGKDFFGYAPTLRAVLNIAPQLASN